MKYTTKYNRVSFRCFYDNLLIPDVVLITVAKFQINRIIIFECLNECLILDL